jgi:hypothetical protein
MNKTISILFVMLFLALGLNAQIRKGALISVFGSKNLSDNPLDTKMYEVLLKDSSFNLDPIVAKFDELIRKDFLPQFPFPFVDKDVVVKNPGYQGLTKYTLHSGNTIYTTSAPGYIPIVAFGIVDDTEAMENAFKLLPEDVDVVMIAYIDFNLVDQIGFGGVSFKKVRANVNLKLFDRKLDRIFKLKENAMSDESVTAVSGFVANVDKILPLINNAAEKLFEEMQEKLPRSLAKMAKKLNK